MKTVPLFSTDFAVVEDRENQNKSRPHLYTLVSVTNRCGVKFTPWRDKVIPQHDDLHSFIVHINADIIQSNPATTNAATTKFSPQRRFFGSPSASHRK